MVRKALLKWERAADLIYFIDKAPNLATENFGLYMIVWESGTKRELLYIGLVKSERRSIYQRINDHRRDWLKEIEAGEIFVKFSVPKSLSRGKPIDQQFIEDIESALIFGAQPDQNTKKRASYTLYEDLVVENKNQGIYLKPSYSTQSQSGRGFRD